MHLQHPKEIDSVRVFRKSEVRRWTLAVTLAVAYAVAGGACYRTSGQPYQAALDQGRLLESSGASELREAAAAHAAQQQRVKLQKLASTVVEQRGDDEDEGAEADADGGDKKKKKSVSAKAREKAELTLARAAKLAEASIASAARGENRTEEELRVELFGEDDAEDEPDEEPRPLPSKYLPNAFACLALFAVCTAHALFWLLCHWMVAFKAGALFVEVEAISNKCHVLIVPKKHRGRTALVEVRSAKVGAGLIVEYQRQLYEFWGPSGSDEDEDEEDDAFAKTAESESDEEEETELVVCDEREALIGAGAGNGSLRRVSAPLALPLEHYLCSSGLDARGVLACTERYGRNVVEVKVPTFMALYQEQLLSPVSMFQVFTSLLWILDSYWQYVGFTLFSIIVMEAGTVVQRQRTLKSLSGMSARAAPCLCFREGKWGEVASDDLLPGDLISVARQRHKVSEAMKKKEEEEEAMCEDPALTDEERTKRKAQLADLKKKRAQHRAKMVQTVPCDCLLLRGSAVANEATLTGESTPQMKDSCRADDGAQTERALEMQGRDRISVLFSGTELVNASYGDEGTGSVPAPPDGGAVGFVLRTGFASSQGELMQMIEFSQQSVSADTRETLMALLVLLVFALISSAYVLKAGLAKGDRTTHELLLRCVIIVTSVVPRQLPMQMALAVNTALMALMKAGVMAIEPFRVPYAGRVQHCLFDKTGTLTTDRLVPVGVVCEHAAKADEKAKAAADATKRLPEPIDSASAVAAIVIAACHSLVSAATDEDAESTALVGDPIELTALRALRWSYDARTSTAKPPTQLANFVPNTTKDAKKQKKPSTFRAPVCGGDSVRSVKIAQRHHFSSALQRMSVLADVKFDRGVRRCCLVKGSPEAVKQLLAPGEQPAWLDTTYTSLAEQGMRVLALAYKWVDDASDLSRADVEKDLKFAGLVAFECKTRADSGTVVRALTDSAHRVAMVTGDAPLTALHVAKITTIASADATAFLLEPSEGGASWVSPTMARGVAAVPFSLDEGSKGSPHSIVKRGETVVVTEAGIKAAALSEQERARSTLPADASSEHVKQCLDAAEERVWCAVSLSAAVFARMSPQGKAHVCRSLQQAHKGPCVLMCGDGGNDVGALKQADVGLALLAGYGDANTTTDSGGYAEVGEKLARGLSNKHVSAEQVLNAQAEALSDAHSKSVSIRKKKLAGKQKDLLAKQKEWIEEELAARAAKGETGMSAQFGAVKAVAMRLRREMSEEVGNLNAKHGNVYDATGDEEDDTPKSAMDQAQALLAGSGEDSGAVPMIRPGDASVAAPFTSRAPSVRAVVDLVRQGRCTLLSSLQQQQIMVLESVISAYTLAALSLEGARSSERQMMASGWLLIVASLAFSYTTPLEQMSPVRPLASLFHPAIVVSVAGQGCIHILCMRQAVKMATVRMGPAALAAVVKFQKKARAGELSGGDDEEDVMAWFTSMWSTPFLPNLLNTAVFLVETSQMIAVLLVNYKGRPWMKGFLENHALFLSLFIAVAGIVLCAWDFVPWLNEAIHLAPFPDDDFRWRIAGLVGASLAGTFCWDRASTALFAPHIFKAQLEEIKAITFEDLKPTLLTAFKVAAGAALLAQGNILLLLGAGYLYRKYNAQQADLAKLQKEAVLARTDDAAEAQAPKTR